MHEQITNLGWCWHGKCGCSIPGQRYTKGEYTLKYFINGTWELRKMRRMFMRGVESELIEKIKAL